MKRFVMMIALLVTIALVCGIAVAEEAKGIYDGVSWQVIDNETLILGDGTEQTFEPYDVRYADEYPWYQYGETITTIRFDGIVHGTGSMSGLFADMPNLVEIDMVGFDTCSVTDLSELFSGGGQISQLDLSSLDTGSVTNMAHMFTNCKSLMGMDLSSWDTSNLQNVWGMFGGCINLVSVDLSGWSGKSLINTADMFRNCRVLASVYVNDAWQFNDKTVESSEMMFKNCSSLVGNSGTVYDDNHTDAEYARVDQNGAPGYCRTKKVDTRSEDFLQSPDQWVKAGYRETDGVSGGADTWHYFENKAGDRLGYVTYGSGRNDGSPYHGRWYDYGDGTLHGKVNGVSFTVESYDELKRLDEEWASHLE